MMMIGRLEIDLPKHVLRKTTCLIE